MLAFIVVTPVILASIAVMIILFVREQYTPGLGVLSGLTGMTGTIVGYYFGAKASDKVNVELTKHLDTKDELLHQKDALIARNSNVMP